MGEELGEIVPELDRLMLRILELMEEEIKNKVKMEETIKDGCLELAKTRYIIGQRCVSSLQLPTEDNEIKALTTVVSSEETTNKVPHTVYQLNVESPTTKMTNLVNSQIGDGDGVRQRIKNVTIESDASIDSDVRSKKDVNSKPRNGEVSENLISESDSSIDTDVKSEKDVNSKTRNGEVSQISSDPMKWFGVLVPRNLRRAQQSFQKALNLTVECATIQNELMVTQERFNVLYKKKQTLLGRDV